jgi:hypothetical protein
MTWSRDMTEIDHKLGQVMHSGRVEGMPVKLKKDYSVLPQRPIRLKAEIGGLVRPQRAADKSTAKDSDRPAPVPPEQRPAKKSRRSTTQWTLRGVSPEAREAALRAAKEQGIPLGQWMDQAIGKALAEAATSEDSQQQLLDRLADIQARLERIEHRPDWWERLKQFLKTCVEYGRSG